MSHPVINTDECVSCGACVEACPADVLELGDEAVEISDADSCVGCGACMDACPTGAISEIADD
jgi:NAD-dependent dihydropyrimidine dehydrogenase PreA subunit